MGGPLVIGKFELSLSLFAMNEIMEVFVHLIHGFDRVVINVNDLLQYPRDLVMYLHPGYYFSAVTNVYTFLTYLGTSNMILERPSCVSVPPLLFMLLMWELVY